MAMRESAMLGPSRHSMTNKMAAVKLSLSQPYKDVMGTLPGVF